MICQKENVAQHMVVINVKKEILIKSVSAEFDITEIFLSGENTGNRLVNTTDVLVYVIDFGIHIKKALCHQKKSASYDKKT